MTILESLLARIEALERELLVLRSHLASSEAENARLRAEQERRQRFDYESRIGPDRTRPGW